MLDTQLRRCKALGPSFVVYDGAREGTKERLFQFLYVAARQEILTLYKDLRVTDVCDGLDLGGRGPRRS